MLMPSTAGVPHAVTSFTGRERQRQTQTAAQVSRVIHLSDWSRAKPKSEAGERVRIRRTSGVGIHMLLHSSLSGDGDNAAPEPRHPRVEILWDAEPLHAVL